MNACLTPPPPARPLRRGPAPAVALLALVLVLVLAGPLAAGAGRDDDRRALAAREGGRVLPLASLVAQIDAVIAGRLLEAELDDEDGALVYELRWQMPDGRRLEIEVDARDGRWRQIKGARLETVFRRAPAGGGR